MTEGGEPRRSAFAGWWAANRSRVEILAIGGLAIGGIVCMALVVLVVIVAGR